MQPATTPARRLTYADLLVLPDDGKRHELIDGAHVVTASPVPPHQVILGNLYFLIRQHLELHPVGKAYLSPLDIVFSTFDVVEPDLLYVSSERRHIVTPKHVRGSPDLLVEILSKSTAERDEGIKLALYERHDVREYWVIDPERAVVRVYRRRTDRLVLVEEVGGADEVLTSLLLPGMALPLQKIFEDSRD
jgi:Uma2 family endonuclease